MSAVAVVAPVPGPVMVVKGPVKGPWVGFTVSNSKKMICVPVRSPPVGGKVTVPTGMPVPGAEMVVNGPVKGDLAGEVGSKGANTISVPTAPVSEGVKVNVVVSEPLPGSVMVVKGRTTASRGPSLFPPVAEAGVVAGLRISRVPTSPVPAGGIASVVGAVPVQVAVISMNSPGEGAR